MQFAKSQQKKVVRLPRKQKQTYRLNSKPQMLPMGLSLARPRPLEFQGLMWPWPLTTHMALTKDFMVIFWNSCISEWEGRCTLIKGGGCRSFMTMMVTIWWPKSGVSIYQIVTGVNSDVGVPSTHLVGIRTMYEYLSMFLSHIITFS